MIENYVKKPIEIKALKWTGKNYREIFDFITNNEKTKEFMYCNGDDFYIDHDKIDGGLIIKTSEGDMLANVGDYIIKEPFDKERKFYPCKADIFEKTYEKIIC